MANEKQSIAVTGFGRLHRILQIKKTDKAIRIDRIILMDCMYEMISAANKVESLKAQDLLEESETAALVAWAREYEREGGDAASKKDAALIAARSIRKRIG